MTHDLFAVHSPLSFARCLRGELLVTTGFLERFSARPPSPLYFPAFAVKRVGFNMCTFSLRALITRAVLGAGTPARRDDGRTFGQRQDQCVAVPAVCLGDAGRRQGRGARHRPQGHRCVVVAFCCCWYSRSSSPPLLDFVMVKAGLLFPSNAMVGFEVGRFVPFGRAMTIVVLCWPSSHEEGAK